MNETTLLVSQLAGPIFVVVGFGMLLNTKFFLKVCSDMEKSPFLMIVIGMAAMLVGLAIILKHNLWSTPAEVVVSLLGWLSLLKGAMFSLLPGLTIKLSKLFGKVVYLVVGSVGILALGGYLSWLGFFS